MEWASALAEDLRQSDDVGSQEIKDDGVGSEESPLVATVGALFVTVVRALDAGAAHGSTIRAAFRACLAELEVGVDGSQADEAAFRAVEHRLC